MPQPDKQRGFSPDLRRAMMRDICHLEDYEPPEDDCRG